MLPASSISGITSSRSHSKLVMGEPRRSDDRPSGWGSGPRVCQNSDFRISRGTTSCKTCHAASRPERSLRHASIPECRSAEWVPQMTFDTASAGPTVTTTSRDEPDHGAGAETSPAQQRIQNDAPDLGSCVVRTPLVNVMLVRPQRKAVAAWIDKNEVN